jgi:hypothetical protein
MAIFLTLQQVDDGGKVVPIVLFIHNLDLQMFF